MANSGGKALSLRAVSLFSGIGGLDFGLEAAGFVIGAAIEEDSVCCRTIALNRPRWRLLAGDIHKISSEAIVDAAGGRTADLDLLVGGPPCQPFSKSGYWANGDAKRLEDHRSGTLDEFLRVLRDLRPRAFLLENVPGLAFRGKSEGLHHLLRGVHGINRRFRTHYRVSWAILNAASFGVPQLRQRAFLVGSRDGRPFEFPKPTHGDARELLSCGKLERTRSCWDALGDLPADPNQDGLAVGGKWGGLLPSIPEGENYLFHTARREAEGGLAIFGWRRRYWSFLLKAAKNRPSWTIQAQPGPATGPFHWRNRRFSNWELCRLQTFPERLRFDCSQREAQRMLGNAVPSLLAEVLALEIRRQLLNAPKRSVKPTLLPPSRGTPPPPEKPAMVPRQYRELVGSHPDHPGEGLGSGARRRRNIQRQASLI